MNPRLAVISPGQNVYTETFIQAHKNIPGMDVYFYYGDHLPMMLEGRGELERHLWKSALTHYLGRMLGSGFTDRREDALLRSFKKEGINCVLAEYGPTGAKVLKVCKKAGLPLVVVFLGYDAAMHAILKTYQQPYLDMFEYASKVIVVSRAMQRKVHELGCPTEKITYSPSGPHERFFKNEPGFSQKLFISTGRFVDKKAHYYTILAFNEVLKKHPDARLVIAGDGTLFNACLNLVRFLGIEQAVSLPGAITLDQFADHLSAACAYVQHSITALDGDMEGTPVAIMEASAAGLPVVSTRHAGIPDVVVDGETGWLVDEHDVKGMAGKMLRLLEDLDLAKQMGARGRNFIRETCSREQHLDLLAATIREAVVNFG